MIVSKRRRTSQLVNGLRKFKVNWSNKNVRPSEELSNLPTLLDNFFSQFTTEGQFSIFLIMKQFLISRFVFKLKNEFFLNFYKNKDIGQVVFIKGL